MGEAKDNLAEVNPCSCSVSLVPKLYRKGFEYLKCELIEIDDLATGRLE